MSKKSYVINKKISILTKRGLKKKGEKIEPGDIGEARIKELVKSGALINESTAMKLKEEAEKAKKDAGISLEEIKKLKAAVEKAQADLVKEKEEFEKAKADFAAEKEEAEKAKK